MALSPTEIQNAYVAFFNRPADVAGLTYWGSYAGSAGDLLNTFAQSAEYNALYKGMNNTQLVNAIYQNLFGRSPDVDGLNYWVNQLDSGKVTIGNAANTIQKGAQGTDKSIIENKVLAATAFTTALDTTAEIVGYAGASSATLGQVKAWLSTVTDTSTSLEAAKTGLTALTGSLAGGTNEAGTTYVLTTEQDVLTGSTGNDNFRAVAGNTVGTQDQTTLNSSDIVDGSTGADTLIVNMTGPTYNGGARIKNIETLQIGTNQPTATFDYNVNAGSNEITEVTKVVYDQINVGENLAVIDLLKTGSAIPTLAWTNEANSTAGTINADFRQSAVEGSSTAVTVELNNVLASNSTASTGRLNIGAGVETLNIVSGGTSGLNTLNASLRNDGPAVDIVSAGSQFNATGYTASEGLNDDGSLKTVVVSGSQAFGKAATVVTDTTNPSFGLVNRAVTGDLGLQNADASASNLVSLAATVTTLDASAATGDTNIRFTSRVDAAEVNVTYKGGKANDYVEFQQGNINATGGDGNDTFAFVNTQNNSTLTTADTIVGGAGTDTLQMGVNGSGTYNLDTTEFNNKSGIDVLDLRGATNTVRLADAFVAAADAGLTVRTDKIVQTSDSSTANSTTATTNNGLENNSTNTITLTALSANRAVDFIGGSGSDRIVVNEVSLNSNVKLDGGTNSTTTGRFDTIFDTITVQDSAVLSRGDLANVKNFEGIVLVKSDGTSARQYTIEVTETFLTNNSGQNKTLQIGTIAAANQNALVAGDTVTIDVSDLLTTSNALKTAGYDRKIDTTSLTAAGVTVQYVANGGAVMGATLQTLGVLASTADASQSLVLASAASAVSNAGAGDAPAVALTASSNVTGTANADNYTAPVAAVAAVTVNGGNGTDTLTLTDAGTAAFGANVTAIERLVLANGTNTVTFNAANGFTTITGGTGNDDVNATNLTSTALNVSLGDGNDKLTVTNAAHTGTFAGGNGTTDTLVTGAGPTDLSGATVTGFETLTLANAAGASFGSNSLLSQFANINASATGSSETIKIVSGSHDLSGTTVGGFLTEVGQTTTYAVSAGATLTVGGDAQIGADAVAVFTGAGTLATNAALSLTGASDTITNVRFAAGGFTITDDTAPAGRNFTGSAGVNTLALDLTGISANNVNFANFQVGAGGDVVDLSGSGAGDAVALTTMAAGGSIAGSIAGSVGGIVSLVALSGAAAQVNGAFNSANVINALTSAGLTGNAAGYTYVALDNGTDTAIYRVQFAADSGADGKVTVAADITAAVQLVTLTGIADVGTLTAANIA